MAFITTAELIEYTPLEAIKSRAASLLTYDILEAETEIKQTCGHDFPAAEYPTTPQEVKLATLKLSQYYAIINSDDKVIKNIKSQNIGDFSFSTDGLIKPDISHLLRNFINSSTDKGNVELRLRTI